MLNPLQKLGIMAAKIILKFLKVHQLDSTIIINLIRNMFTTVSGLILTIGIMPTISLVSRLRNLIPLIRDNHTISIVVSYLSSSRVPATMLSALSPILKSYLEMAKKYPFQMYYIYTILLWFMPFTIFKRLTLTILRWAVGLTLSSLGILWNETLQAISFLKTYSDYIIEILEGKLDFRVPRLKKPSNIANLSNAEGEAVDSKNLKVNLDGYSDVFNLLGIILLGLAATVSIISITQWQAPNFFENIPYIGSYLNTFATTINSSISNTYQSIIDWFYGTSSTPPGTPSGHAQARLAPFSSLHAPESISRTSSGGSDKTITQTIVDSINNLTPPASRSATPLPEASVFDQNLPQFTNPFEDKFGPIPGPSSSITQISI
jgi:hypothetical protein